MRNLLIEMYMSKVNSYTDDECVKNILLQYAYEVDDSLYKVLCNELQEFGSRISAHERDIQLLYAINRRDVGCLGIGWLSSVISDIESGYIKIFYDECISKIYHDHVKYTQWYKENAQDLCVPSAVTQFYNQADNYRLVDNCRILFYSDDNMYYNRYISA